MKYSPYSFSKMSVWNQCHRKFKYIYVDKIKLPYVFVEALVKGGAVHSIIEHFPEQSKHKYAKKYFHVAEKFLKSPEGWDLVHKPALKEYDFGLTKDLKPCGYSDKSALFRGSVDRAIIEDGMLWLVDFKTGKSKDQNWQSYDQLMFYAIYFFIKYPNINKIKITYYYIEHMHTNDLVLDRTNFDTYAKQLVKNIIDIEADEDYIKIESKLCDYCDYFAICQKDKD